MQQIQKSPTKLAFASRTQGGKPARLRKEFIQFFGSRIQKLTNMSLSDVTFYMLPNSIDERPAGNPLIDSF